ncbi:DUF4458 domain-containing protein [Psychroflexus montanilacus]|uniref:DUF4458 domain-containing protein n=1 Tax=Psychroflexus montanilacus TaxID=2873598 RepID=UPI001CCD2EF2|nr:DUF4458 domain-containing protein [Psychroflexus montanilacus]MBZ9651444.1 DUF4458 domain-containing protein [Psychroflexus montanilacus]
MKNLLKTFNLLIACLALVFMYSCQDEESERASEEASGVEFLLSGHRVDDVKSDSKSGDTAKDAEACDMAFASYAILELGGMDYTIDLKTWGDSYKTDLIELDPGTYQVTSFQLYDGDDNPLYATPTSDSEFGAFVSQSLPFEVTVENYRKIEYDIEVLCIEEFTPPQFGFIFWDVSIKEVKNLCVFTNFCEPDSGHAVASLEAFIYPNEDSTSEADLIWSGSADGDFDSETEENELLCLKFPYDPSIPTEDQSYFIELYVNGVLFEGTMPLDRVDEINAEDGYLHLNENCDGDFDIFSNSFNIAWEDLDDNESENDCDYNDLIVKTTTFTDINTGNLNFRFEPVARGGGYSHAFKFWLPGTGYVISGDYTDIQEISGNTMIEVYPNTSQAFSPSGNFVNTTCSGTSGAGDVKTVTVESAPSSFVYYLLNPFDANLNVNGGPNYDLTIGNLFAPSTFIKDGVELENGLITPSNWEWVVDGVDIRTVYGNNFQTNFTPTGNTQSLYVNCP